MKAKFLLSLLFFLSQARANPQDFASAKEFLIEDRTYTIDVDLNPQTVLCLIGDYGANSFKIAVPQINDFTFLDHTSPGAPGPCINAGFCKSKETPHWGATTDDRFSIFHDLQKPTETVAIRVVRKEVLSVSGGRCVRNYMEHISSTIRGTLFQHVAYLPLAEAKESDCQ